MVAIRTVHASNALLSSGLDIPTNTLNAGLTFVFAGATAGIGLSTLKAFAKYTAGTNAPRATAYIIGRSRARFQPHLDELARINPQGRWVFLEGQLTLLKEGKRVADEIIRMESEKDGGGKIDALVTSTGFLTFNGAIEDTEEGIDADCALIYYNRLLLAYTLLHLLSRSPHGRVVTVFSAGQEGPFTIPELQSEFRDGFARLRTTFALASLTTLAFEQLAKQYPNVAFVHSYPGGVKTEILDKLMDTAKGWWRYPAAFANTFLSPLFWLISKPFTVPLEETGERHLFLATSAAYPSAARAGGVVPLVEGLRVQKASVVDEKGMGNGVYRTSSNCETVADKKVLSNARKEGLDVLAWRETIKVFKRVLGEGFDDGL